MRWLFVISILALALNCTHAQVTRETFTSDKGEFSFQYTRMLVHCRQKPSQPDSWFPGPFCNAYGPVCGDTGGNYNVVACFAYPSERYKNTNFQAAAFSVAEITNANTKGECLGEPQNATSAGTIKINGVRFTMYDLAGAGLGNDLDGELYMTLHHNICYALSVRMWSSDPANYDPGTITVFTDEDRRQVFEVLKQSVHSFKFLK